MGWYNGGRTSLTEAISKALKDNCEFKGNYYHSSTVKTPINPGLSIEGIGTIGLPLTDREAKLIVGLLASSSTTKPNHTKAGIEVGGPKISIANPKWKGYVEELVSKTVWPTLSAGARHTPELRCELVKATLHQPGTSTQETKDSPQPDGAFATLTLVLPSASKGGEVRLSIGNGQPPVVLDSSKNGTYSTSVLAWYSGLPYSVQPVASGNRLALTYNITLASSHYPRPSLPSPERAISALVGVLQKWKNGEYKQPEVPIVACTLTSKDIRDGRVEAFEDVDAAIIKSVLEAAKQLGFAVGLANMTRNISGTPDEDHWTYAFIPDERRSGCDYGLMRRFGFDDVEEERAKYLAGNYETPPMGYTPDEETQEFKDFIRIDGGQTPELKVFSVKKDSMVTSDAVKDAPDEQSFDPKTGIIKHHFKRAALVLYPADQEVSVLIGVTGAGALLKDLGLAKNPSPRAVKVLSAVIGHLEKVATDSKVPGVGTSESAIAALQLARQWKLLDVWNKTAPLCKDAEAALIAAEVALGIKAFKVGGVQAGLTDLLKSCAGLHSQYEILKAIRHGLPKTVKSTPWADEVITKSLTEYNKYDSNDAPALVSLAGERGLYWLKNLLQSVPKEKVFDFSVALMKPLTALRNTTQSSQPLKAELDKLLLSTISSAIAHLDHGLEPEDRPFYWSFYSSAKRAAEKKVQRVCEFIEVCIACNDLHPCSLLWQSLFSFKPDEDIAATFETLHIPLISQLKTTLSSHNLSLASSPFDHLTQLTIGTYLHRVLGPKPASAPPLPQSVGCGACYECLQLSNFLLRDSATTETRFKSAQAKRTHLEGQIRKDPSLALHVTTETLKSTTPHTLVVRRSAAAQAGAVWNARREQAEELLKAVSEEEGVLKAIMGSRYDDVKKALDGSMVYQLHEFPKRKNPEASSSAQASKRKRG